MVVVILIDEIDNIPNEILEGIIEINTNEESRDIMEAIFYSMHERIQFVDLIENINIKKKAQNKNLNYLNFFKSLDILEEKGLIKPKHSSPPSYYLNPLGMKTLMLDKHFEINILIPIEKQLKTLDLPKQVKLRNDIRDSFVESLKKHVSN